MTEAVPARLFAILPRAGRHGVVFRRGPNRVTAMIQWDLKTDSFKTGQWLRGHVYERRCDLSPDGKHLIAALSKYGGPRSLGGYTVVCRPPYYTALAFHAAGHAWNGGGYFVDDRRYWLDAFGPKWSGPDLSVTSGLQRTPMPPPYARPGMGEDFVLYPPRLVRDGWTAEATARKGYTTRLTFTRELRPGWTLHKTAIASIEDRSPTGAIYWERHSLIGPDGPLDLNEEWAEAHGRSVVFAQKGRLWRMPIHAKGPGEAVCLIDTNPMTPRQVIAPYAGVQSDRRG